MAATQKKGGDTNVISLPDMPDPSTLLDTQIQAAQANMEALKPAVDNFRAWEEFANRLIAVRDGKDRPATTTRRRTASSGERSGRGDRPAQFLTIIKDAGDEGVTITEAAERMGMNGPNYLYRLAPDMEREGLIRKDGKRWFVNEEAVREAEADAKGEETADATAA
jgi:hypothetical protein